jgi:hypothetical protein
LQRRSLLPMSMRIRTKSANNHYPQSRCPNTLSTCSTGKSREPVRAERFRLGRTQRLKLAFLGKIGPLGTIFS